MKQHRTFRQACSWAVLAVVGTAHLAGAAEESNTNFVARLGTASKAQYPAIAKEAPKLVAAWQAIMQQQAEIKAASAVFGVEARRSAESRLAALQTAEKASRTRFSTECESYHQPFLKRIAALRDEAFRIRQKPEESRSSAVKTKLDELDAEVAQLDDKIHAIDEMRKLVANGLQGMPTTTSLLGLDARDPQQAKLIGKHATLIQARKLVKDCEVDLEALRKGPDGTAGKGVPQRIAATEKLLVKATAALDAEVVKANKASTDEIAKLTKKLESFDKQVAEAEKRKRPPSERIMTERAELQTTLTGLQGAVATIKKLAGVEPAPPPAK